MKKGTRVFDRWWPWINGVVIKRSKYYLWVRWEGGKVDRYDKAHQQFLELA